MGDTRVEGRRRWAVLWVHYEAEELRVHHRTTIAPEDARAMVMSLLASGRVPPPPPLLDLQRPGAQPLLQRFWGTVSQPDETAYLILFINDRCLLLALDTTSGGQP